jgi:acyl carrier protein
MKTEDIRRGVDDVLSRFTRKLPGDAKVTDDSSLRDDLRIDSADMIEIALELEEHFKIAVPEEAINKIKTLGQVVRLVQTIISDAAPAAQVVR